MAKSKLSPAERMLVEVALAEHQMLTNEAESRKQARLAKIVESHPEAKDGPYSFESEGQDIYLVYTDSKGPALPREAALKEAIPITRKRREKPTVPPEV